MATLKNDINAQNIVDRFADYVVATGNASIGFASNAVPFGVYSAYFPNIWGGTTTGKAIGITGANLGGAGSTITASTIVSVLRTETATYTRIRNLRALLFITGTGYAPTSGDGSGANYRTDLGPITGQGPGYIYDSTQKANLSTAYLQTLGATTSTGISTGSDINTGNLETFFTNLQTAYATARDTTHAEQVNVCHASCHVNCHSSRGRR
jgi:hypothetical protein